MPDLLPFRDYDEHDVLNLFAFDYTGGAHIKKGSLVKIVSGWTAQDNLDDNWVNGATYGNTLSPRYAVRPKVQLADTGNTDALGILLYDVRETDENGEKLLYNPSKAAEMQVAISGQAVPIATKGIFLMSGFGQTASTAEYTVGSSVYPGNDGELTLKGTQVVGKMLGPVSAQGWGLVKIDL